MSRKADIGVGGFLVAVVFILALALGIGMFLAWLCLSVVGGIDLSFQQTLGIGLFAVLAGIRGNAN